MRLCFLLLYRTANIHVLYSIMQKPPSIDLKFDHAAPALLDELFKLDVIMTSSETEPVEATLCAEIKNSEGAGKL